MQYALQFIICDHEEKKGMIGCSLHFQLTLGNLKG